MNRSDTIRAITFDAAGTLLAPAPSVGHIYAAAARRYGVTADGEGVQEAFLHVWRAATMDPGSPPPFDRPDDEQFAWWRSLVIRAFERYGGLDRFGARFEAYYADLYEQFARPAAWSIFDDVIPALERLAAEGMPAAIVSNWDSRLNRLIAATPIARYVQFVLTSGEARSMKPAAPIFREAASRLGFSPSQILHVGDSLREDVEGARLAGCHALHLDRAAPCASTGALRSLNDLIGFEPTVAMPRSEGE